MILLEYYNVVEKNPFFIVGIFLSLALAGAGCKTTPAGNFTKSGNKKTDTAVVDKSEEKPLPSVQSMQIPIGIVHMVDAKGKFVLIKSSKATTLEPETRIMAYGQDASLSSNLKVSPARKGSYLTADLIDGMPSVGDMVMMVQTINKHPQHPEGSEGLTNSDVQVLE